MRLLLLCFGWLWLWPGVEVEVSLITAIPYVIPMHAEAFTAKRAICSRSPSSAISHCVGVDEGRSTLFGSNTTKVKSDSSKVITQSLGSALFY